MVKHKWKYVLAYISNGVFTRSNKRPVIHMYFEYICWTFAGSCSLCPPWTLTTVFNLGRHFVDQLLIETGPAGTHSVFEILQTHDRNSEHILLQSTPDSIIDEVYVRTVRRPDRKLDEVEHVLLQKLDRSLYCFSHCVSCRVGLLSFILSHYKLLKNICKKFAHMLLRIDYISTCVNHFKCTLLLEDIISWHEGGRFFMAHCVVRLSVCWSVCLSLSRPIRTWKYRGDHWDWILWPSAVLCGSCLFLTKSATVSLRL